MKREIQKQIRELKREMKANHIRIISFMNGGLTSDESRYNCELYRLKLALERATD